MKKQGFFGIGCLNMKYNLNYGTLFRTAQIFDADFLFLIGERFKPQNSDTMKSYRRIPTYHYEDFKDFLYHIPYDCSLIGIEIEVSSVDLKDFVHPKRACYILGSEDHGLSQEAKLSCKQLVRLPGDRSLNVSVAGSIVLYDRITKNLVG